LKILPGILLALNPLFCFICGSEYSKVFGQKSIGTESIIPDYFFNDPDSSESNFLENIDKFFNYYKLDSDTDTWCKGDLIHSGSEAISIHLGEHEDAFSFPFKNYITSPFGPRGSYFHSGIDIKLRTGDTIRAVFGGTARVVTVDKGGYGKLVILRHKSGLETLYAHLSKLLISQNVSVSAGDVIALGGNTGRSSGSHLHFECRHCGEPFDPLTFLNFENYTLINDTLKLTTECFGNGFNLTNASCHKVKKGDTLSGIASKYRLSVKTLCRLNNITPQTVLKIGKNLILRNGS
jgi:murein DD-endopeptidase MepM/ murein hydrolase activator NlpD